MELELSHQAFHHAWEHFRLGAKPLPLNVLPHGNTETERRRTAQHALEELHRLGIHDRDRSDDLYGLFVPLHRYDHAFDLTYRFLDNGTEQQRTALVADARGSATLGLRRDDAVRMVRVSPDRMVPELLGCLPEMRPGRGKSVSLRSAHLDSAAAGAGSSRQQMTERLLDQGVRREDAWTLVEMLGEDHTAYAQFGASQMDILGNRTRATVVTNCFATTAGWYLMEETRRSGEPWTTFAPIDKTRMEERVHQLRKAFPRQ